MNNTLRILNPELPPSKYCRLSPNGKIIEIRPNGDHDEVYELRPDELESLSKLYEWIRHLSTRTGYTRELLGDLVLFHARLTDPNDEYSAYFDFQSWFSQRGCFLEEEPQCPGLKHPVRRR